MTLPSLTVVVPSYNQGRFLRETLSSIASQRGEVHELFVLDGGSTDHSVSVIREFEHQITSWRSERDGGQGAAIAEGFNRATGDILCWLNSDDLFLPGALRTVRETFARHPSARVVTGWSVKINAASNVVMLRRPPPQTLKAALRGVMRVSQPACFFRRSLYEDVGGIDTSLGCVLDTELWYRMLAVEPQWCGANAVLAAFRIHPDAKGSAWLNRYSREYELMRAKYPQFARRDGVHAGGRLAYRVNEVLSGRYARDLLWTGVHRGTPLERFKVEGAL